MVTTHYEGRETEEWWWGGTSSRFDHRQFGRDPEDERVDYNEMF